MFGGKLYELVSKNAGKSYQVRHDIFIMPIFCGNVRKERGLLSDRLRRNWNRATTVLVALVVVLAVLLGGVRLVGLTPYAVLSGSMEPTYHVGALLYVKTVDCAELKVGDPLTFRLDADTVATHRIVEILSDGTDTLRFRTKGDANSEVDGDPVREANVIGKPVFTIPLLGYLAVFLQNPPGTYLAIAAGAVLLILIFLPDLLSREEKRSEEEK